MKHRSNGASWEMANFMCEQVLKKTQNFVAIGRFLSLSVDEVTTINN
jgi:hypothetical protein